LQLFYSMTFHDDYEIKLRNFERITKLPTTVGLAKMRV